MLSTVTAHCDLCVEIINYVSTGFLGLELYLAEKLCSVSSFIPVPLPMTVKRLFGGAREEILQLTVEMVVPASQCCGESPIGKVLPFGIATV